LSAWATAAAERGEHRTKDAACGRGNGTFPVSGTTLASAVSAREERG